MIHIWYHPQSRTTNDHPPIHILRIQRECNCTGPRRDGTECVSLEVVGERIDHWQVCANKVSTSMEESITYVGQIMVKRNLLSGRECHDDGWRSFIGFFGPFAAAAICSFIKGTNVVVVFFWFTHCVVGCSDAS